MHITYRSVLAVLVIAVAVGSASAADLPVIPLTAGTGALDVEVASNKAQRSLGLMNRTSMPDSRGMLFVYPAPAYFCMWMKNTKIPLSVAFLDAQGRVINIEDMSPQSETNHCTQRHATYALEVNRGWFTRHGVNQGSQIIGLEKSPQGEY